MHKLQHLQVLARYSYKETSITAEDQISVSCRIYPNPSTGPTVFVCGNSTEPENTLQKWSWEEELWEEKLLTLSKVAQHMQVVAIISYIKPTWQRDLEDLIAIQVFSALIICYWTMHAPCLVFTQTPQTPQALSRLIFAGKDRFPYLG